MTRTSPHQFVSHRSLNGTTGLAWRTVLFFLCVIRLRAVLFLQRGLALVMVVNLVLLSVFAGGSALALESSGSSAATISPADTRLPATIEAGVVMSSDSPVDLEEEFSSDFLENAESESEKDSEDNAELELCIPHRKVIALQVLDSEIKLGSHVCEWSDQWLHGGLERPPRV